MFWKDFERIGRWKTEFRISDKSSAPKSTATCRNKPMFIESYIINQNYQKKAENQKSIDGGSSIADKIEANIKKLWSKE